MILNRIVRYLFALLLLQKVVMIKNSFEFNIEKITVQLVIFYSKLILIIHRYLTEFAVYKS